MRTRVILFLWLPWVTLPQSALQAADGESRSELLRRGEYLVHHVAMCVQCHSPRTRQGELIEDSWLQGGRIPFTNPYPTAAWASFAPRLAGLPGFREAEIVTLLTQGHRPSSRPPRAPMPPFRFRADDAEAIVTYLKSIGP